MRGRVNRMRARHKSSAGLPVTRIRARGITMGFSASRAVLEHLPPPYEVITGLQELGLSVSRSVLEHAPPPYESITALGQMGFGVDAILEHVEDTGYSFTNAEAAAVVAAFDVEPDDTRKALIDDLVSDLKAADVWDDFDIFYVQMAHDVQAAKVNWKNPAAHFADASGTFVADDGFTSNFFFTNWNKVTDGVQWSQSNAACGVYKNTFPSGQIAIGDNNVSGGVQLQRSGATATGNVRVNTANNSSLTLSGGLDQTLLLLTIGYNGGDVQFYRQAGGGANAGTTAQVASVSESSNEMLGYTDGGLKALFAGAFIDNTKQIALHDALAAYQAAL